MAFVQERELWLKVMEAGRSRERGVTNRLYGPEIATVMERFAEALFQIQVWRDLAVARFKLYDATGMWLQSRSAVAPPTYEDILKSARAYLDESVAPQYFERLRSDPLHRAPAVRAKQASHVTRTFDNLPKDEQLQAIAEFYRELLRRDDWLYSLRGGKIFAAQNETGGYTLMLAEDY